MQDLPNLQSPEGLDTQPNEQATEQRGDSGASQGSPLAGAEIGRL